MSDDDELILVCARINGELLMPDNVVGRCDVCDRRLQYRPHAPVSTKRCTVCAFEMLEAGDEIGTTPKMLADYKEYLRKSRQ